MNKILRNYQPNNTEIDFRYTKYCENNNLPIEQSINTYNNPGLTKIDKMKAIGKIGEDNTILDQNSSNESLEPKYGRLKLESVGSFASIRANNCVYKGKWFYEVQLLSSKLCQIGWV